jgi:hypothetical protein
MSLNRSAKMSRKNQELYGSPGPFSKRTPERFNMKGIEGVGVHKKAVRSLRDRYGPSFISSISEIYSKNLSEWAAGYLMVNPFKLFDVGYIKSLRAETESTGTPWGLTMPNGFSVYYDILKVPLFEVPMYLKDTNPYIRECAEYRLRVGK